MDGSTSMYLRTQEASHMETWFHLHPADGIGQHSFGMRVHDAVDSGVLFKNLAMDAPFLVSLRHTVLDG